MIINAKFSEIPRALSQGHLGPPSSNQPSLNHSRSEICLERQQPADQDRFTGQQRQFVGGFYNTILQQTISKDNPNDNRQIQDFKYPNRAANNKEQIPTNPPPPYAECSGSGNNTSTAGASTSASKEAKNSDLCPAMEMATMAADRAGHRGGSEGSERAVNSGPASGKNVSRHFSTGISDQYSQKLASQS